MFVCMAVDDVRETLEGLFCARMVEDDGTALAKSWLVSCRQIVVGALWALLTMGVVTLLTQGSLN